MRACPGSRLRMQRAAAPSGRRQTLILMPRPLPRLDLRRAF